MEGKSNRGRPHILRLRPGVAANFSGGYGYMPFVLFLSAPLAFLSHLVANLLVYHTARQMRREEQYQSASRVSTAYLQHYLHHHWKNCAIVYAVLSGFLTVIAARALYEYSVGWYALTLALAAGPLLASLLSTIVVGQLTLRWGPRVEFLFVGLLTFIVPFVLVCLLLWLPALGA